MVCELYLNKTVTKNKMYMAHSPVAWFPSINSAIYIQKGQKKNIIVALFVISKTKKQPKRPPTVDYYSWKYIYTKAQNMDKMNNSPVNTEFQRGRPPFRRLKAF